MGEKLLYNTGTCTTAENVSATKVCAAIDVAKPKCFVPQQGRNALKEISENSTYFQNCQISYNFNWCFVIYFSVI